MAVNDLLRFCELKKEISDLLVGLYQWGDKSLAKFDNKSSWWCRRGIAGFGFDYPFNEPTRNYFEGVGESCVLYRRGKTSTGVLCLDDIFCNVEFPFVCEKST